MKKKLSAIALLVGLLVLAACGKAEEADQGASTEVLPLDVELTVTEQAEIGETVTMEAVVTYGDEKVEDADKVVFEVWEEGKKEDSTMIDAVNEKNGSYTAETTFDHDGLFHIQSHVDAKQLHSMPVKKVTIGHGASAEETHEEGHGDDHDGGHEEGHGAHEHGHTDGFALHFVNPENSTTTAGTELMTHLQIDGKPLEQADVRYEISSEVLGDKHLWVDASETVAGEYTASHTFEKAGSYVVKIHVKNDDGLHEHEEYTVEVK